MCQRFCDSCEGWNCWQEYRSTFTFAQKRSCGFQSYYDKQVVKARRLDKYKPDKGEKAHHILVAKWEIRNEKLTRYEQKKTVLVRMKLAFLRALENREFWDVTARAGTRMDRQGPVAENFGNAIEQFNASVAALSRTDNSGTPSGQT